MVALAAGGLSAAVAVPADAADRIVWAYAVVCALEFLSACGVVSVGEACGHVGIPLDAKEFHELPVT